MQYEKLFYVDNEPFIAEIKLQLKENCNEYNKDFKFIWDDSLLKYKPEFLYKNNTMISLDQNALELGIFEIKAQIFFKDSLLETLKEKSNIAINKVNKNLLNLIKKF